MRKPLIQIIALVVVFISLNIAAVNWDQRLDLTPDNRFSVGDEAMDILRSNDEYFVITVLLEGNVPPSFKAYRDYIDYYRSDMKSLRPNIALVYRDPNEGTVEEVNSFRAFLRRYGVNHLSRQVRSESQVTESVIYPYISVHNERKVEFIDLLEARQPGESEQSAILRSMGSFEEKIFKAIRNISTSQKYKVGVLDKTNTGIEGVLNREVKIGSNYEFQAIDGEGILERLDSISALISIVGREEYTSSDILAIDQAVMAGIPIIWLVDKVDASIERIRDAEEFIATANDHVAEDMLFKWGVRVNPDIVSDLNCSPIPQVTGTSAGQSQTTMLNYPYHILAGGLEEVALSRGIGDIHMPFVSSIDTLSTATRIQKRSLVSSSQYSKTTTLPLALNFVFLTGS